ncbi:MAG: 2'-5' RNA ligase family protein [Gemmatimonadaceae bacterium]|nr:2'-5' RNA ligase family protein [Gemmatimonadaceae bacterium]
MSATAGRIFVLAALTGDVADRLHALQRKYDPKLARAFPPHVTLAGSSGLGPVHAGTPAAEVKAALERVAAASEPLHLALGEPHRFMQSDVVSFPLDPHGPIRALHDRLATSGLKFEQAKFTFTPHVTISFYPELTRERARELLALRVDDEIVIARLEAWRTREPQAAVKLASVLLGG